MLSVLVQEDNFCPPWECLCCPRSAFLSPFSTVAFPVVVQDFDARPVQDRDRCASVQHSLHKLVLSFRRGQVVRETMGGGGGGRKAPPGSEDLSPSHAHFPGRADGALTSSARSRAWAWPSRGSPLLFAPLRSSAAAAGKRMELLCFCPLNPSCNSPEPGQKSIFKHGTDGWSFLLSLEGKHTVKKKVKKPKKQKEKSSSSSTSWSIISRRWCDRVQSGCACSKGRAR